VNLGLAGSASAPRLPVIPSLASDPALIRDNASKEGPWLFCWKFDFYTLLFPLYMLLTKFDNSISHVLVMLSVVETSLRLNSNHTYCLHHSNLLSIEATVRKG
jgi:hypothetical protein